MADKKSVKSDKSFFTMFRKRGFSETLEILANFENHQAVQSVFFEKLVKQKSYPNSFFRVKNDLISNQIIAYKLNENNDKVIYLTEKGEQILSLLEDIDNLIYSK